MTIIAFEGPSKAGKTTMATAISAALRWPRWSPLPTAPEKEIEDFKAKTNSYKYFVLDELSLLRHIQNLIIDRHPIISERVYSEFKKRPSFVADNYKFYINWWKNECSTTYLIYIKKRDAPEHRFYEKILKKPPFPTLRLDFEQPFHEKFEQVMEWIKSKL